MSLETDDSRIGTVLQDRYRIVRRLAVGSMSVVYRGQRVQLGRPVAIKFLRSSMANNEEFLKRFELEARTMSRLSHPNCISVIDFGVTDAPYIVMDLVPGRTLKDLTDLGPIAPDRSVRIIRQLMAGLAHAHKRGIIHRDIKPANVMLTEATCTGDYVRVFDFGLAKLMGAERIGPADSDTVAGTLDYMSPEHASGKELDARADLFSTGVVLYQLLTGSKPFKAVSPAGILHMHEADPPLLRDAHMAASFSLELEGVVTKALARRPEDRFQTAIEFATALDSIPEAAGPALSTIPPPPREEGHPVQSGVSGSLASSFANIAGSAIKRPHRWTIMAVIGLFAFGIGSWLGIRSTATYDLPEVVADNSVVKDTPVNDVPVDDLAEQDESEKAEMRFDIPEDRDARIQTAKADQGIPETGRDVSKKIDQETKHKQETKQEPKLKSQQAKPPGLADVNVLIRAGKRDAAIAKLRRLEQQNPRNAYLLFLLGNLYSEQKEYLKALSCYEIAIISNDDYRSHKILIGNVVRALGDNEAFEQARLVIVRDIGSRAIPELKRITRSKYNHQFISRAQEMIDHLTSQN
ncbi:MAG: protein kinase [Proteobacteria bacterium]|nr:protein kinase [Pseudomonadota bacterium]